MSWGRGSTRAWRTLRAEILQRDPHCRISGPRCTLISSRADHITPLAEGGAEWDPANLQGACVVCHDEKTQREASRGRQRQRQQVTEPHPGIIPIPPGA